MSRLKRISLLCLLLFTGNSLSLFAQGCANCKTAVESDLATGGSVGGSLNNGILYLMAIPYVIIMAGAYFFFKKPIDAKVKGWKNKLLGPKAQS